MNIVTRTNCRLLRYARAALHPVPLLTAPSLSYVSCHVVPFAGYCFLILFYWLQIFVGFRRFLLKRNIFFQTQAVFELWDEIKKVITKFALSDVYLHNCVKAI